MQVTVLICYATTTAMHSVTVINKLAKENLLAVLEGTCWNSDKTYQLVATNACQHTCMHVTDRQTDRHSSVDIT